MYCRRRPVAPRHRPFCSERCRLLDLAAWAEGRYRIPGRPLPSADDAPRADDENGST
ncbi:MAG: DNA gyrase inhibitor YacG [Vicinamibacteraceae bacterium]|nr:DNA gyrase inhibitor YacG [Vicinamibacteraceae bacterium]